MLYSNMKIGGMAGGGTSPPEFVCIDADVVTDYDAHKESIEELMLRFYPANSNNGNNTSNTSNIYPLFSL